jgi:hypothetical protein
MAAPRVAGRIESIEQEAGEQGVDCRVTIMSPLFRSARPGQWRRSTIRSARLIPSTSCIA